MCIERERNHLRRWVEEGVTGHRRMQHTWGDARGWEMGEAGRQSRCWKARSGARAWRFSFRDHMQIVGEGRDRSGKRERPPGGTPGAAVHCHSLDRLHG